MGIQKLASPGGDINIKNRQSEAGRQHEYFLGIICSFIGWEQQGFRAGGQNGGQKRGVRCPNYVGTWMSRGELEYKEPWEIFNQEDAMIRFAR